jgi:hypothetical protein
MQTIIAFIKPPDDLHRRGDANQNNKRVLERDVVPPPRRRAPAKSFSRSIAASLCRVGDISVGLELRLMNSLPANRNIRFQRIGTEVTSPQRWEARSNIPTSFADGWPLKNLPPNTAAFPRVRKKDTCNQSR